MFRFKEFSIDDSECAMKVGTDGVLLGSWADVGGAMNIVDAGCGSGLISLMMAQRAPQARIYGVDIDGDAVSCCQSNVNSSRWKNRIEVFQNDITSFFPENASSPLLIVSNPPFFNEPLRSPDTTRALARHGEEFGIESLLKIGAQHLEKPEDSMAFISPYGRKDEIEWLLSCNRLAPRRMTSVFSKKGKKALRILWQVMPERYMNTPCVMDDLYIRDEDNEYSTAYKLLTSPFYLDK